jgi:hypothetical protein
MIEIILVNNHDNCFNNNINKYNEINNNLIMNNIISIFILFYKTYEIE